MFCKKSVLKNFVKLTFRIPVSDSDTGDVDTGAFQSILLNVEEHLFYWTPLVVASSNFKAPGFTQAVMQMNFWNTHDLAHLNTLSSSWHFCVYFRQSQAFRCISTACLTLDILYFFWQKRTEISWYLDQSIFFWQNFYRNNHRMTSILLSLGSIDLMAVEM